MPQTRILIFVSRVMLGLWLALAGAFLGLLVVESPSLPNTPFASLSIAADQRVIYLPNRAFACVETEQDFQCRTEIQAQPLQLAWAKGEAYAYDLGPCRASYAQEPVDCQHTDFAYVRGLMKLYMIKGDLGLSPSQLRSLQQKYWGINLVMQNGFRLLQAMTGLAIAAGLSAALFAWLHPNRPIKVFAGLVCGFGIYHLVLLLLRQIPVEAIPINGLTTNQWSAIASGSALGVAIAVSLATVAVLRRQFGRWVNLAMALAGSVAVFNLCWFSLSMSYLSLNISVNHQTLLVSAVISVIPAIAALVLLWKRSAGAIKAFVCLSSGFGAFALASFLLSFSLLGLGYLD